MRTYLAIEDLSDEEFEARKVNLTGTKDATKSDQQDVQRIENILDLAKGTLQGKDFFISKAECQCGRSLTFYDLIFTSLVEQWHDPSFVAHTLTGRKKIINSPRPVRCSACGSRMSKPGIKPIVVYSEYETPNYGCCKEEVVVI